ncbi:sensor domain-containing diguanylate cyclase [Acerihabitans arboris]|uniref:Diguanylate cyclase n=1 Tax=Acerihabitans arboris TaxID=2691583 RepID=A0A845SCR2_9GAMM|nr:sensor domain-containing diguanylate cyclase [Acerihabitans arboris]NDL61689.1 diguanylate cyclase [Acerihabitans arboris]
MSVDIAMPSSMSKLSLLEYIIDNALMVTITDAEGVIQYANQLFCQFCGFTQQELIGNTHCILNSGVHDDIFFTKMRRLIKSGDVWRNEICNKSKSGKFFWEDVTIIPELDSQGNVIRYVTIRFDVTKQVRSRMKFFHKSQRDNLTRVFNRHGFYNQAGQVIKSMSAAGQTFYVAIFDADKFKIINDTLGHNQGDKLLRLLAVRTKNILGDNTLLGRLGGDEFALLFPGNTTYPELCQLLDKLQHAISEGFILDRNKQRVFTSLSIGVAHYPHDGDSFSEVLKCADIALYKVKNGGGNDYLFYHAPAYAVMESGIADGKAPVDAARDANCQY